MKILRHEVKLGQCFRYMTQEGRQLSGWGSRIKAMIRADNYPGHMPVGWDYANEVPKVNKLGEVEVELLEHYSTHPIPTPLTTQSLKLEPSKKWPWSFTNAFTSKAGVIGQVYQLDQIPIGAMRSCCQFAIHEIVNSQRENDLANVLHDHAEPGDDKRYAFVADAEMRRVLGPGVNNPGDTTVTVGVMTQPEVDAFKELVDQAQATRLANDDVRITASLSAWRGHTSGKTYESEPSQWTPENRAAWSRQLARLVKAGEEAQKRRELSVLVDLDFFE